MTYTDFFEALLDPDAIAELSAQAKRFNLTIQEATDAIYKFWSIVTSTGYKDTVARELMTPRQCWLMNHGAPRVRKKWSNAMDRKAKLYERRHRDG